MNRGERGVSIFSHIVLLFCVIICVVPFWLLISASLTGQNSLTADGYKFIPKHFSLDAYHYLGDRGNDIVRAFGVSVFVTIVGTLIGIVITALIAYPLSRKETPYRNIIMFLIFFTMLFNGGLIPSYLIYTQVFHLKNTIWALIFPGLLTNGFYIVMARSFFQSSVPSEIIESAQLDGASEYRIFWSIAAPLSVPILATLGLFFSIMYWNEWMNGMIYLTKPDFFSLQNLLNRIMQDVQFITQMTQSGNTNASTAQLPSDSIKMAIATIGALPILIAYPFFQKYFIKGIALGAVKG